MPEFADEGVSADGVIQTRGEDESSCSGKAARPAPGRQQFFFEKKNQKTFDTNRFALPQRAYQWVKVFCFFSSEKKGFLAADRSASRLAGIRAGGPRQFAPERARAAGWRRFLPRGDRLPEPLRFRLRVLRADLGNFFFIQHRHMDGFLVTGKNSGSHWLKFMLSAGIAAKYGLDLPAHSTGQAAETIVGHPSRPRRYQGVPRIGTTHTIPSGLHPFACRLCARRPPIVLMVRAIDAAMLSNYTKWHGEYRATLAEYVRGDPGGGRFVADIWWYVHFFNRWGDWAAADPARILVVRYEDLAASPAQWLPRIADHLRLGLDETALAAALAFTGKDTIRLRQDPQAGEIIVPDVIKASAFAAADNAEIERVLKRYLRRDFGYVRPNQRRG